MSTLKLTTLSNQAGDKTIPMDRVAQGVAAAWARFNASSGTPVISAAYNVSSITDNGVGDYTINFATALPDANYSYWAAGRRNAATPVPMLMNQGDNAIYNPSTSGFRFILVRTDNTTQEDPLNCSVQVFR